jgi:hypothetical protein
MLAAEGMVRLIGIAPSLEEIPISSTTSAFQLSDNPKLAYGYKPNYRAPKDGFDYADDFPYINAHGFRDIERTIQKPAGVLRVALVGDSVVAGNHAGPKEKIIGNLLDTLGGENIEVLSFGVAGYSLGGYIALIEDMALKFDPDLVVMLLVDDFNWGQNAEINREDLHNLWPLLAYAIKPSHLLRLFTQNPVVKSRILKPLIDLQHQRRMRRHEESVQQLSEVQAIQKLAEHSRKHGYKLVAIAWPIFNDQQIADPSRTLTEHGEEIPTVAKMLSNNIPVLTLTPLFRDHYKKTFGDQQDSPSPREAYAPDTCHPTVYGHAIAAQFTWLLLQQANYLPAPNKQILVPEFVAEHP